MKILIFIVLLTNLAFAQTDKLPGEAPPLPSQKGETPVPGTLPPEDSGFEKAVEAAEPLGEECEKKSIADKVSEKIEGLKSKRSTRDNRADSIGTGMIGFQAIATWVPLKKTVSYTHIFNEKWSLEGEYSWSSLDLPFGIDLGAITERRASLLAKYYTGNSFNFQFGPYFSDFEAEAGSDMLQNISGTTTTSSFGAEALGLSFGMGNRWQWESGFTLGIDWLRLNVPLVTTEVDSKILSALNNGSDEEGIKKVIRRFNRIPTFVLFGINLGYTF